MHKFDKMLKWKVKFHFKKMKNKVEFTLSKANFIRILGDFPDILFILMVEFSLSYDWKPNYVMKEY